MEKILNIDIFSSQNLHLNGFILFLQACYVTEILGCESQECCYGRQADG